MLSSAVGVQRVVAIWRLLLISLAVASASISPCLGQSQPMVPHRYERQTPTETPDGDVVSLKTADGMLVIWNRSVPYFTMSVPGRDFAGFGPEAVYYKVDGVFLQVLSVQASGFVKDKEHATSEQILYAHRDWDFANMKRSLGEKSRVRSVLSHLDDGTPLLYWEVEPEKRLSPAAPSRYLMVTRTFAGAVIGATSAEEAGVSLDNAKRLVFQAIGSVRFSTTPVDVARIQRELRSQE